MKRLSILAFSASAMLSSSLAHAQTEDAPRVELGARRQWFFASGISASVSHSAFDHTDSSSTSLTFAPGFDYFVARHFSLGAEIEVTYLHTAGTETTGLQAGPRIGYAINLGRHLSLYPRLGFGLRGTWITRATITNTLDVTEATPAKHEDHQTAFANLYVPLLVHVAPRFFLGVGPGVSRTFAGDTNDVTEIYGRFVVGMVLGGPRQPEDAPAIERFGDRHSWVFTGEENSSISHSEESNSTSTTTSVALRPGVDYFVARHFSIGGYVDYTSTRSDGTTTRQVATGPRVGYDIALGRRFSIWPRFDVAFGRVTTETETDPSPTPAFVSVDNVTTPKDSHATTISLGLGVPVLFHVATHAFVGFGPYVRREAYRHYDGVTAGGNANTTFGLDLLIGGWL